MKQESMASLVDAHAHFFPLGMTDFAALTGDPRWPTLRPDAAAGAGGAIYEGQHLFRRVSSTLWDVRDRIGLLDEHGIATQLISPVPIMLTTWADPALATAFARETNDGIAAAVAQAGGRLAGLATVPLPEVGAAITELERAVRVLGLSGVEIGTQIAGHELDDPALGHFFAAAADLDAAIFVHPLDGGAGALRRTGQPYDFGLGMLTDTALATIALLTGGVVERFPDLRFGFAHGCGTFAWAAPRVALAMSIWGEPGRSESLDDLVRRLWVDTLVLDPAHLPLLVHRFGADHVMVGTDAPFIPTELSGVRRLLESGAQHGLSEATIAAIAHDNARAFFARRAKPMPRQSGPRRSHA